jgi:predicted nucleic acid-binding protein
LILADTSAWVEYDRATGSLVDQRMTALVATGTPDLVVTEPVLAEVLFGARDGEREADLRRLLGGFGYLPFDTALDFDGAVGIYRRCREAGVTPRGLVDCLIANIALRSGASVLAHDVDLARIANVVPLWLDEATLRPAPEH